MKIGVTTENFCVPIKITSQIAISFDIHIHTFRKRQTEKLKVNCEKYPKSPKEILLP